MNSPRLALGGQKRASLAGLTPFLPVLVFLALLYFAPLLMLLSRSVISAGGQWTGSYFSQLFASTAYIHSLWITIKISAWTALACVIIGYPLAFLIANAKKSLAASLMLCVLLPYSAGVLVRTFAWMVVLGRNGPVNSMLVSLGIVDQPLQMIYNLMGVMLGMINAYTPLAVLVMASAMQSIDQRLLRAASTLGAGAGQAFWRIYFPLSLPGVVSALLLIFISSLGTFITPSLLGSGNDVMIAQIMIEQVEQLLNWGFAGAVGVLILLATLLIFVVFSHMFGMNALTGQAAASPPTGLSALGNRIGARVLGALGFLTERLRILIAVGRTERIRAANTHTPLLLTIAILVLVFLVIPVIFLVPVSFTGGSFIEWPPRGFSTKWYEMVLGSDTWLRAGFRSIYVGLSVAALAVILALPAAIALTRRRVAGQRVILVTMLAPMIIPHILLSVALLLVFAPLGLVGEDFGLILGHTVICLPYTFVTLMAVLSTYDRRLDLAANTMGAGTWQRLWRITLPLIRPGLIAAFLIAFVTSFEELTIAMFITGGLSATLPKQLWSEILMAVSPALAAVSTLMLAFIVVLVVITHVLRSRYK